MDIKITIKEKIATLEKNAFIVCGNSDYVINFSFDEEWAAYKTKTARFMHGGNYTDVVFDGEQCSIPVMRNTTGVYVGVFAGDMHTTTPAYIPCKKSIACIGGAPAEPTPDVYAQLLELINAKMASVSTIDTINGGRLHFFVGTQTEYESLTAEEKENLFAIITDDKIKDEIFLTLETLKRDTEELKQRVYGLEAKLNT